VKFLASFAVVLALVTATSALAQTSPPTETAKKVLRNVSGTVRSASADTVVVAGRDKGKDAEWTFAVEPVTNIRKGSKAIVAGDLRAGDPVYVRYVERDGKATAESIVVKAPRKEAKKADAK
jgi:hypothetical protein